MSRVIYTLTAPVSRLQLTTLEFLQPVHFDLTTGICEILVRFGDSGGNSDQSGIVKHVQFTQAQVTSFLNTLVAQAQANAGLPAGTVAVVP
jgi:hypothetical protein